MSSLNLVQNGSTVVSGNVASFNGTSGRVIQDTGIASSSLAVLGTALPRASWRRVNSVGPNFTANTWLGPSFAPSNSSLTNFTINGTTGVLTYTGTLTRTFYVHVDLNLAFVVPGGLDLAFNKNGVSGFSSTQTQGSWAVSVLDSRISSLFLQTIRCNWFVDLILPE